MESARRGGGELGVVVRFLSNCFEWKAWPCEQEEEEAGKGHVERIPRVNRRNRGGNAYHGPRTGAEPDWSYQLLILLRSEAQQIWSHSGTNASTDPI
jgi:hypothetical protein